ncbi:triose-phosphate isomerase [Tepidanaerobacter acetatoxydans]|uniref:triose-phosphate isomerase n=1 Tax=Tepidanaerobacter acetatoxydans TaxID=499229 RepID=UPI00235B5E9E|nr:triose-phosphate isomerase [Tepidanaerobacter acetatoxydans]
MSRKPLIAGNWKMNNTKTETIKFLDSFLPKAKGLSVDIVICPPFTNLFAAAEKLEGTDVKLGAQNMHWEDKGAFTGEVSPVMLKEIPCDYVIIGHSERRQYFAETDETVNKKIKSALQHDLLPIVCVGESLAQREEGITMSWIMSQVENALKDIPSQELEKIVFAYEPIWAIGTGKTASASDAQEVISAIRKKIAQMYCSDTAEKVRILYGGSVKPENIKELMQEADIDGALVGGASLKPDSFYALCTFNL